MKKGCKGLCLVLVTALMLGTGSMAVYADELNESVIQEESILEDETEVEEDLYDAGIADTEIGKFIIRLYEIALNRQYDPDGLENWYNQLVGNLSNGTKTGYGFVFSQEFLDKNLSNEDYINILYRTFLNREADEGGLQNWMSELEQGVTRLNVFKGFVESNEYTEICARYGISRGSISHSIDDDKVHYRDQSANVTKFVTRCYRLMLNRDPDLDGLESWCETLFEDSNGADKVVKGFVFSEEMNNRNLSDGDFVEMLYTTFLDRQSDPQGFANWCQALTDGKDRSHVAYGFIYSDEFSALCQSYGLEPPKEGVGESPFGPPQDVVEEPADPRYVKTMTYSGDPDAWYNNIPDGFFDGWEYADVVTYFRERAEVLDVFDVNCESPIQDWLFSYYSVPYNSDNSSLGWIDPYQAIKFTQAIGYNTEKAIDTDGDGYENELLFSYTTKAGAIMSVYGHNLY